MPPRTRIIADAAAKSRAPGLPRAHGGKVPSWALRVDGYLTIGDYGIIGDCRSVAMVGVDGSIDWCCLPRFDSPSIFGRLVDQKRGGSWQISPIGDFASRQEYADKTNILRTIFQTADGLAVVTDFMPVDEGDVKQHARPHRHPRIVRMVTGLAGTVRMRMKVDARPNYGTDRNPLVAEGGKLHGDSREHHYCISGTRPIRARTTEFTVRPGDTQVFALTINRAGRCGRPMDDVESGRDLQRATQQYWWKWINQCTYTGPYQLHVWRSALALKLLTYAPTGAIVAAPTTSLPEWIGGQRNWDYRYTWVRDASFTLYALFQLGFQQEATDFMEWVNRLTVDQGLKILYNLDGRSAGAETELKHLSGYRNSAPVRIGNGAEDQVQLDIYGELLDTVFIWAINGGKISQEMWRELRKIVDFACRRWEEPDAGLWEVRGEYLQFTYSKAMCWVAVDRGLRLAERFKLPHDKELWEKNRALIHAAVMRHGWSKRLESFTQSFGSDQLDASAVRLVQLGFLPLRDRRLRSTIDAIDAGLSSGPLVYRYHAAQTDDGFSSPEGSFIICAYWLADALALVGDLEQAERRFERLLAFNTPLGLIAEEVDPDTGALLGNFPQAFSHLALISAAVNIERQRNNTIVRNRDHNRSFKPNVKKKPAPPGRAGP
ncbi:MAG: glycoside hydrolase family 15 protein [Candidatus Dormibacteria bacterium]